MDTILTQAQAKSIRMGYLRPRRRWVERVTVDVADVWVRKLNMLMTVRCILRIDLRKLVLTENEYTYLICGLPTVWNIVHDEDYTFDHLGDDVIDLPKTYSNYTVEKC